LLRAARASTPKNESFAEVLQAFDQLLRIDETYSIFEDMPPEIVMANMLWTMRKINKRQQLEGRHRELLENIERTFAFKTRREAAMAMLLWELRKEHEQRCCTILSHAATEAEMLIRRIDDTLTMNGA